MITISQISDIVAIICAILLIISSYRGIKARKELNKLKENEELLKSDIKILKEQKDNLNKTFNDVSRALTNNKTEYNNQITINTEAYQLYKAKLDFINKVLALVNSNIGKCFKPESCKSTERPAIRVSLNEDKSGYNIKTSKNQEIKDLVLVLPVGHRTITSYVKLIQDSNKEEIETLNAQFNKVYKIIE